MHNTWVVSDTHFSHKNIIGHGGRPFADVEEMNRELVGRWNSVVKPGDKVFHLGDVAMWKAKQYQIVRELNGNKHLLLGNHDTQPVQLYTDVGFKTVRSVYEGNGYVLTHVPVHESQLARWGVNVHGHTHQESVGSIVDACDGSVFMPDMRYRNVCVEQTDYFPVLLSEVLR